MKARLTLPSVLLIACFTTLTGCAQHIARSSASASLNRVIEPVADSRHAARKTPLTFPTSVAIVTIPGNHTTGRVIPNTTLRLASEQLKQQLLADPKYVRSVQVVEKDDMGEKISLEKIRSAYGADIAIVLSYQQDQRTNQGSLYGLLDATIVGMFIVPGVEVKTSSIIDGKVIHIPSNAIVFRSSGKDARSIRSTTFAHEGTLNEESINGIVAATEDFGNTLGNTLSKFDNYDLSQAVPLSTLTSGDSTPANDYWEKVDTYKNAGGGAFGVFPLLLSAALFCSAWRRR